MRALIVFESIYGNTRTIAEHVAVGLSDRFDATVVSVVDATPELVDRADLLVCGGPTHVHGLSSRSTRRAAFDGARKDPTVDVLPGAEGDGIREWLEHAAPRQGCVAAAFDTRVKAPAAFTGRASKRIARRLHRRGCTLAVAPESFLVDKQNHLLEDQSERAEAWGRSLAVAAAMYPTTPRR